MNMNIKQRTETRARETVRLIQIDAEVWGKTSAKYKHFL